MRMRLRTNAYERLAECAEYVLPTDETDGKGNVLEAIREKKYFDLSKVFGNDNPIYLEIGCGQGKFACETARRNPSVNVLGVEKISNVILTGVEEAAKDEIPNVRFMRAEAEILPKYIISGVISGIYLNFSTPLPRKGYVKQRLTSPRFLAIYRDLLVENGFLSQKTDDGDFFRYSIEEMEKNGFEIIEKTENLHQNGIVGIVTEYEKKFLDLGMPIYALKAVKRN